MREDIVNSIPDAPVWDRREFFVTSIFAAGAFGLAAQSTLAQTQIKTDAVGLTVGEVKIPVADGEIPAYCALPEKKGQKYPVVLVIHEIFGVNEWVQDVCRRFAKVGYMAIAPALYARQGEIKDLKDPREINRQVYSKIPDKQAMSDLDSCVAWAAKNSGDIRKLSITGFCWGGRIVWIYSEHNPNVKAGAAWYGRLTAAPNSPVNTLQPANAIDHVADLKAQVIGFYGGLDTSIPADSIQKMRDELAKYKSKSEINVYPNAKHGFFADYRDSYNKEAAEDAWPKLLAWFKKYGAA